MFSFVALSLAYFATSSLADKHFTLELTWDKYAPDGFEREMILVNGGSPGPLLEMDEGEWVEVDVVNNMPYNTSIHYHGIEQLNTPWADGVPGLSQRPIQPGDTFKHKWHAGQYGSYFYHAHARGQIDDGCYGPMVIHPKAGTEKPFDKIAPSEVDLLESAESKIQPLIVMDWRHTTSDYSWSLNLESGIQADLCMDSIIINGKGYVDCWSREDLTAYTAPRVEDGLKEMGLAMTDKGCLPPKFTATYLPNGTTNVDVLPPDAFDICEPTTGSREIVTAPSGTKWLALDIVSSAGIHEIAFGIDEHPLWVFAVDGHYIEPMKVDALDLASGDRYSVFIELNKPAGNYGIRAACTAVTQLIDTTALLTYEDGGSVSTGNVTSKPFIDRDGTPISDNVTFFNQSHMVSFPPQFPQPAPEVDQTFILTFAAPTAYTWAVNTTMYDLKVIEDTNPPFLYQQPTESNPGANITIRTKNDTWVDLIFQDVIPNDPSHPMHKHSNKMFILGQGEGKFNYSSVAEAAAAMPQAFNLVNPPYRDSFLTPSSTSDGAWLAARYHVVNPGAWIIHCHVQSHFTGGMAMAILDGVDVWPEAPADYMN